MELRHIEIPLQNQQLEPCAQLDISLLHDSDPKRRYGFAKELVAIAGKQPAVVMERLPELLPLLDGDNQILKSTVIDIIGLLSGLDDGQAMVGHIPLLLKFLHGGELVTCNHTIATVGLIARRNAGLRRFLLDQLLDVAQVQFDTEECKAIAVGKVIEVLAAHPAAVTDLPKAGDFIARACRSQRTATVKKAIRLRKSLAKGMIFQ